MVVFRDVDDEHTRQVWSSDVARLWCEDEYEQVKWGSVRRHDACRRNDEWQWFSEMLMLSTQDKYEAVMLRDFAVKVRTSKGCVSQLDGTMFVQETLNDSGFQWCWCWPHKTSMKQWCCETLKWRCKRQSAVWFSSTIRCRSNKR